MHTTGPTVGRTFVEKETRLMEMARGGPHLITPNTVTQTSAQEINAIHSPTGHTVIHKLLHTLHTHREDTTVVDAALSGLSTLLSDPRYDYDDDACPIYTAVSLRVVDATLLLLKFAPEPFRTDCLFLHDPHGLSALHVAFASKAAAHAPILVASSDRSEFREYGLDELNAVVADADVSAIFATLLQAGRVEEALLFPAVGPGGGNATLLHIALDASRFDSVLLVLGLADPDTARSALTVPTNVYGLTPLETALVRSWPFSPSPSPSPSPAPSQSRPCAILSSYITPTDCAHAISRITLLHASEPSLPSEASFDASAGSGTSFTSTRVRESGWNSETTVQSHWDEAMDEAMDEAGGKENECTIRSLPRSILTSSPETLHTLLALRVPFIVRQGVSATWASDDDGPFSKDKILRSAGHVRVRVSSMPYGAAYGMDVSTIRLSEFVASLSEPTPTRSEQYLFLGARHNPLTRAASRSLPPALAEYPIILEQFALGGPGTGAQPHFHGAAINGLIAGTKRWFFASNATFFDGPASAWTGGKAWESETCVQYPGDLVFVPSLYGHAVSNALSGTTLAIAIELLIP